ncbi:tolloid-like protein 1 [Conger conger]|uniref:tolloid-like protein 1 n=1 Tax=Conger conger TaxID=82655 RepID=UPI002A5A442A|nr:tolloid-like protein 1 [Conger conger]
MGRGSFTTLEKCLIALFVALTGVCIGMVVVYVTERQSSTGADEGEGDVVVDSGCGNPQKLMGSSGEFTSKNYPNSYDNGRSCSWQITVSPDKVIHLWFEDFSLEETDVCSSDFVTIQDNLGIIGKYCGLTIPKPLVSLGNSLVVYFDSNDRGTEKGFKARFSAVSPESTADISGGGGHLQGTSGDIQSPGFPAQNYENGALYQWRITVPEGEQIRLTFFSFDLVPDYCGDYVDVYDSNLLGHFCGGKIPSSVVSSGNTMVVRFKTDNSLSGAGFSATYRLASTKPIPSTTPSTVTTTPAPLDSGCGSNGLQMGRRGVIQSKDFPQSYPADLSCVWTITVPEGFLARLTITDISVVGEAGNCGVDGLDVADGLQWLGKHCGYILPPVLISSDNKLSVSFLSDSRLTDQGFSARWEATYPEDIGEIQGCGGASHEEVGVIKSKNWPMNYAANSQCLWIIQVPVGKTITLTFTHFEVEESDPLIARCYDSVLVYDGMNAEAKGPFCGSKIPDVIQSTGNQLLMRFRSDFLTEAKGFRAHWTTDPSQPAPTEPPTPPNPWDDIPIDWPETCGTPAIPPMINSRIVNGVPAKPHSWPWQVSMQVIPESQPTFFHTCGGTLIHKNWVLTAAHCFIQYADELPRWRMCFGKHNLTLTEPTEQCLSVMGIYRHEGFKYPQLPTVEFDIALVRLDGEVLPTEEVSFACWPPLEEVLPEGKKCYATGWGDETGNSTEPKVAETLNQVDLPVVPYDTCKRMDYWWFQVKPSMICSGYNSPDELKSVCQGDSGGPLVCQDNSTSPWEVHGITSFGPIGCIMDKKPSVFTRVSAYLPWIEQVIRKKLYDLYSSGCGGAKDVTGLRGSLSTMNHPRTYSNNAACSWNIKAPLGKLVRLHFHNFSLEDSQFCMSDQLQLFDHIGSLGTHCGSGLPGDLVTTSDTLNVQFASNFRVVDTGFRASWTAIDPADISAEVNCGGHFEGEQGEFASPGWPKAFYPALKACSWRITVESGQKIYMNFTAFYLQGQNVLGDCNDHVTIYDGVQADFSIPYGPYCGSTAPPALTTQGNAAIIRFLSNGAVQNRGFHVKWKAVSSAPTDAPTTKPITDTPKPPPITDTPTTKPITDAPITKPITDTPTTKPITDAPTIPPITDAPTIPPITEAKITTQL